MKKFFVETNLQKNRQHISNGHSELNNFKGTDLLWILSVRRNCLISNDSTIFFFLLFTLKLLESIENSDLFTCLCPGSSECLDMHDLWSLPLWSFTLLAICCHFHLYNFRHITYQGIFHDTPSHAGDQIYFYL